MEHKTDDEYIKKTHNTERFSVEHPHITWVLLIATLIWGVYGYTSMPQRKDPDIPVREAQIISPGRVWSPKRWSSWSPAPLN